MENKFLEDDYLELLNWANAKEKELKEKKSLKKIFKLNEKEIKNYQMLLENF